VPWILTILQGDGQMALFAKSINLVGLSILIVTGLNSYFQPLTVKLLHRDGVAAMKRAMNISFAIYSSVLAGLCIVYALAGYSIINLVYETTDAQQGTLVTLLGLNVLAFSFAVIAGNGLAALKLSLASFWGELANFCVTAVVAVPLIMWRGSIGAALAILTGSLASAAVTLWMLRRSLKRLKAAKESPAA
jgi:O-antigen/teichoic acid export membrane protein